MSTPIPNVLASRYASPAMQALWSPTGRVILERDLWIAVLRAQRDLGLPIPAAAITAYAKVKDQVDLAAIDARERVTLHDVKARIETFNALAGHELIHLGLTSRDLTENVEQLQVHRALQLVRLKTAAALLGFARQARAHRDRLLTGRTHNVAAQPTTLGKRFAMFGEELLTAYTRLDALLATYPARGLKGAVGTRMDQISLFDGDSAKASASSSSASSATSASRSPSTPSARSIPVQPRSAHRLRFVRCHQRPVIPLPHAAPHGRPRARSARALPKARSAPPPCRTR
jgi:adenylosuccinate lyase